MAGGIQVPLRPKLYHCLSKSSIFDDKSPQPQHGHPCEYLFNSISISINALFIVGSVCFFDNQPLWVTYVGDWLFIIGSVTTFALTAWAAFESWAAQRAAGCDSSAAEGFQDSL